jgi:D-3-phosphoglycerate dehydrogenase
LANQSLHRVLISDKIADQAIEELKSAGLSVVYEPDISAEELTKRVADTEALIVRSRTQVTADVIRSANRLRIIGRAGVGLDNIDVEAAKEKGIMVVNAPDSLTNAVAEHALALMLAVARQIGYAHSRVVLGEWPKQALMGHELTGRTLGIVGFGRIGRRLAELVQPFKMKELTYDIILPPEDSLRALNVRLVALDELLASSDFISMHVPATPQTINMISDHQFSIIKKGAILVNTSRGGIIDENALVLALKSGKLGGAGLDVYSSEPPKGSPLLSLTNVVLTPHIAGQTVEAQISAGTYVARQIIEFLSKG